jgi:hypothetical protein
MNLSIITWKLKYGKIGFIASKDPTFRNIASKDRRVDFYHGKVPRYRYVALSLLTVHFVAAAVTHKSQLTNATTCACASKASRTASAFMLAGSHRPGLPRGRACYPAPPMRPVRLAYQPPATFVSEQTSHQQPVSSTFLSEQTSTSHQPTE